MFLRRSNSSALSFLAMPRNLFLVCFLDTVVQPLRRILFLHVRFSVLLHQHIDFILMRLCQLLAQKLGLCFGSLKLSFPFCHRIGMCSLSSFPVFSQFLFTRQFEIDMHLLLTLRVFFSQRCYFI